MTPVEYDKIKQVFARAVALPRPEREAFVREQCEGNEMLAGEVLSLLSHHSDETILDDAGLSETLVPPSMTIVAEAETPSLGEDSEYLVLSEVWEDNREILRRRLTIIAAAMIAMIAASFWRLFTYHSEEWGYGGRGLAILVYAICILVLRRKRDLSIGQIRLIEWVIVGNVGVLAIVVDVRLMLASAAAGDEATLISANHWHYFVWTLIIFVYSVFMPNRWQRAACILLPLAAIPTIITTLVAWYEPEVANLMNEDKLGEPIVTPFAAACVAIYAAHTIHGARVSAFQARKLAQYRLKRLIGEGGMGQVFEAEHLMLKRDCAIKLIRPEFCENDKALARFEREVRATAKLTHPHTIDVYDYGQTKDNVFFFAMELLPGKSLRALVDEFGPVSPERAIHFLIEASEALGEAHVEGMIHRDVKPANIFASQRGGIWDFTKLLDFGLVRETQFDPNQSITVNMVAGTPGFMSPEQIRAPNSVDTRTDLYSLGCVGHFLLTGKPPFTGRTSLEVILAQSSEEPAALTGAPEDLASVISDCMAKEPDDRIQDVADLRERLRQCACAGRWREKDAAEWWADK